MKNENKQEKKPETSTLRVYKSDLKSLQVLKACYGKHSIAELIDLFVTEKLNEFLHKKGS